MRRLVWVPIVHTVTDLGSLGDEVRRRFVASHGPDAWLRRQEQIAAGWRTIRSELIRLGEPASSMRLYQDGLPICEQPERIVADLADQGSANHRLLREMMEKGAILTGTEDPELLVEEVELAKLAIAAAPIERMRLAEQGRDLLRRRDRAIAARIAATLEDGRLGILLLGALHDVAPYLPPDIIVQRITLRSER